MVKAEKPCRRYETELSKQWMQQSTANVTYAVHPARCMTPLPTLAHPAVYNDLQLSIETRS